MRNVWVSFLVLLMILGIIPSASAEVVVFIKNPRPPIVIVGNPYPKFFTIHPNNSYTVYLMVLMMLVLQKLEFTTELTEGNGSGSMLKEPR